LKIKKYLAGDMKEAIRMIKKDLGPEAVIINSRKVRGKGIFGIFSQRLEVTAVLDEKIKVRNDDTGWRQVLPEGRLNLKEAAADVFVNGGGYLREGPGPCGERDWSRSCKQLQAGGYLREGPALLGERDRNGIRSKLNAEYLQMGPGPSGAGNGSGHYGRVYGDGSGRTHDKSGGPEYGKSAERDSSGTKQDFEVRRELAEVKTLINRMVWGRPPGTPEEEFFHGWRQVLLDMDIYEDIVNELMDGMEEEVDFRLPERDELFKVALSRRITQMLEPVYENNGKVQALSFIGPTGVGKTTTLAKLAAQYTLFHQKSVALVTVDTYRIGAVEQLKTYAEIIGVPVEVVMTPVEMKQAMEYHADKDLVLIDTAGRPSGDTNKVMELKKFLDVVKVPHDIFLVLSCNTKRRDLAKAVEDFKKVNFSKLIFTKIDETLTCGCILNMAYRLSMPVAYVTDGQNVPDDIQKIYPKKLAKLLLRGVDNFDDGSGV